MYKEYLQSELNAVKSYMQSKDLNNKSMVEKNNLSSSVLPQTVTLTWDSLSIRSEAFNVKETALNLLQNDVQAKKYVTILENVNGMVRPGELLGLMGPSGSGKTSLLNALNYQSKNLKVTGQIRINGQLTDSTRIAMISSYVPQEDLFFGTMTVREHLVFHVCIVLFF